MLFGACSFFLLPRTPGQVALLSAEEKRYVEACLLEDGSVAKNASDDDFKLSEVGKAFTQPHVLLMAIGGFTSGTMLYALA